MPVHPIRPFGQTAVPIFPHPPYMGMSAQSGEEAPVDDLALLAESVARGTTLDIAVSSYRWLEESRPDLAAFARFSQRVETASIYMFVAFDQGGVRDFVPDCDWKRPSSRKTFAWGTWLADTTLCRFEVLRSALRYEWTPPAEAERWTYAAFQSLCDLTPASSLNLRKLFFQRRNKAMEALIGQLDLTLQLMTGALDLYSDAEHAVTDSSAEDDAARLEAVQVEILGRAGTAHSLSEAAGILGMTRQNLHKRIGTGSALGVMRGKELVVPSIQFEERQGKSSVVGGLKEVLRIFREEKAGDWSALQFLVEQDPGLGEVPMNLLKDGKIDRVLTGVRAYLGVDEG